jgi:hypothetical protein
MENMLFQRMFEDNSNLNLNSNSNLNQTDISNGLPDAFKKMLQDDVKENIVNPHQIQAQQLSQLSQLPERLVETESSCESSSAEAPQHDEFYLYQKQLKADVKSYLDLDDQIKALNKATKERRTNKAKLAESILSTMKMFEIENMNTKNGRLIYSVKKTTKGLNKKNLLSGLNLYFKDTDKAKDATSIVLENREVVERISLKRSVNKKSIQIE